MLSPPLYMSPQEDINYLELYASQKTECTQERNTQERNVATSEFTSQLIMFYILSNFTFKQELLDCFNVISSQTTGLVGTYFVVSIHFREA